MSYTPGPWEFDGDNPLNQGFDIAFPNGGTLATAYYCVDGKGKEIAEANAQLIAATPELLEAAKNVIECFGYREWLGGDADALEDLKKAIAKAEGT